MMMIFVLISNSHGVMNQYFGDKGPKRYESKLGGWFAFIALFLKGMGGSSSKLGVAILCFVS